MAQKVKIGEDEYDVDNISDTAKATLKSLQFVVSRIEELTNMRAVLQRAKNSYGESLKNEILSQKAGFILDD